MNGKPTSSAAMRARRERRKNREPDLSPEAQALLDEMESLVFQGVRNVVREFDTDEDRKVSAQEIVGKIYGSANDEGKQLFAEKCEADPAALAIEFDQVISVSELLDALPNNWKDARDLVTPQAVFAHYVAQENDLPPDEERELFNAIMEDLPKSEKRFYELLRENYPGEEELIDMVKGVTQQNREHLLIIKELDGIINDAFRDTFPNKISARDMRDACETLVPHDTPPPAPQELGRH